MPKIIRFGVSLDSTLLKKFDPLIKKMGYKSRSEAIRDLIREKLVTEEWAAEEARWLEGTLDYAAGQGIPIWSAAQWLQFTKIRHDSDFEKVQWYREICGHLHGDGWPKSVEELFCRFLFYNQYFQ